MGNKAKIQVIFLVILMLVSFSLTGAIFFLYQKTQQINTSLQREKDDLLLQAKEAAKTIEDSQKTISDLSNKLNESRAQIETLNSDLEQAKSSKEEALGEAVQLKMDLEKQKTVQTDLENKLNQAQDDLAKAQAQLSGLESKKAELETKIKELVEQAKKAESKDVELGKIVVTPETGELEEIEVDAPDFISQDTDSASSANEEAESAGPQGRVLVINKEYNFAVLNLGTADGINIGDIFSVYHDEQYIGDLKVEKVHDSMSAAGFESQGIKDKISEGDKVKQQNK